MKATTTRTSIAALIAAAGLLAGGLVWSGLVWSGQDRSTPHAPAAATALPLLTVHKSPSCGCCVKWIEHMREAGFPVEVHDTDDMLPVKQDAGVPFGKGSCHTGQVGGYFVEGHVPAADVKRLLAEKPQARGLTVPGMPAGSPGMEMPDGRVQPYAVELVADDGSTSVFARHGE